MMTEEERKAREVERRIKLKKLEEEQKKTDALFAKAFDKLDFNVTLNKLKMLGIDGKIGRWIHSFLTGCQQSVVVNGESSGTATCYYIDTIVRITGVTTGYGIDIPVRFVRSTLG